MELLVRLVVVWAALSVVVSLLLGLLIRRSEPVDVLTRVPQPIPSGDADVTLGSGSGSGTVPGVVVDLSR